MCKSIESLLKPTLSPRILITLPNDSLSSTYICLILKESESSALEDEAITITNSTKAIRVG